MKTKFLLPVLAMIFATGMSFATIANGDDSASDYIRVNNQWMAIPEIDCQKPGAEDCEVKLTNGNIHKVYDTNSFGSLKKTTSEVPFEL